MVEVSHGFRIDRNACRGCLTCMRACPTHAIRVRDRKASYRPERCIDCGACLTACPAGAITATTWSVEDLSRFRFKVAVPCPVLFGQFPAGVTPEIVEGGLRALGFDAVWDYAVELALAARAIHEYVEQWRGTAPLISIACPVVVRLVQVSYPRLIGQLIPIQLPRELAGRAAKRKYGAALGVPEDEIAAIYITPCQAKTISILHPAEGGVSHLDGTLAINHIYNSILAYAQWRKDECDAANQQRVVRSSAFVRWHVSEGLGYRLPAHRSLRVTGLDDVIHAFDDVEKGKLRKIDFLEAYNCWSGCTGGNLTVANVYEARRQVHSLVASLPETDPETEAEIERRYPTENFSLEAPIRPRPVPGAGTLRERIEMMRQAESILGLLPGLDCGLCGAPTCQDLARDASMGQASKQDCIFLSKTRLAELRRLYLHQGG